MTVTEKFPSIGRAKSTPTPEQLSELIGNIYDCALDPAKWESVLATICGEFAFDSAMMGIARLSDPYVLASVGLEPEFLARLPALSADMAAQWGGLEALYRYPLDEPILNSQVISRSLLEGNAYTNEWLSRGVIDAAVIFMARDATMFGNVGFNRHQSAGAIGDVEINGLRLLAPHFRRAVTISNLFDMKRIEAATLSNTLDSFGLGIVLVDADLAIVHANTVAAGLLAAKDSILSVNGKLTLHVRAAQKALLRAVQHAAGDNRELGSRGIGIPAQRDDGEASVIHVLPLRRSSLGRSLGQRAAAALFIAPGLSSRRLPADALALLYDLTPAEIRVFELIVSGEPPAGVAKALGVAHSTVRTHLIHLFQKTGCQRQSELVKLAADLSLPL